MSDVEEVARAICTALGKNPDAQLVGGYTGPRRRQWEGHLREATAALAAIKNDEPNVDVNRLTEACRVCGGSGRVIRSIATNGDHYDEG
mgnify:FL=1